MAEQAERNQKTISWRQFWMRYLKWQKVTSDNTKCGYISNYLVLPYFTTCYEIYFKISFGWTIGTN